MASTILANVAEKAKEMTAPTDKKQADMATVTRHVHGDRWRITSDFGVKQTNTDAWLHVGTEDKQGPRLLEDHFGREKVLKNGIPYTRTSPTTIQLTPIPIRSTASITNESLISLGCSFRLQLMWWSRMAL